MPMWTCGFASCQKPAVRTLDECVLCNRHLCAEHLQPTYHTYPKWTDADRYDPLAGEAESRELTEFIAKINTPALASRASHLRGGIPCSIPPLSYDRATRSSVIGGMNYHIEVCFDDGVKWLACSCAQAQRYIPSGRTARLHHQILGRGPPSFSSRRVCLLLKYLILP